MKDNIKRILAIFIMLVMGLQYIPPVLSLATEEKSPESVVEEKLISEKEEKFNEITDNLSEKNQIQ